MRITDFEGSWLLGPKTFAEITGRKRLWAGKGREQDWLTICTDRRACPLCGEANPRPLFSSPGGVYERCLVCGMVYVANVPTPEFLDGFYRGAPEPQEWAERVQQNRIEKMLDRRKFWWALDRAGWKDPRMRGLLDIGCSTGTLLETAADMRLGDDVKLVGVETNDTARTKAAEVATDVHRSIKEVPFTSDLVVLWEVLEHVLDPRKFLQEAVYRLAPHRGATLMICVPNIDSLAARVLHEKAPMFGPGHLNMYGPDTLRSAILEALPGAKISMTSIVSWSKEVRNWMSLLGPFDADDPKDLGEDFDPETICKGNLEGYKLVAWAKA
jgi:SAM-dependent methyltransferase